MNALSITVDVEDHVAEGAPNRFQEALAPLLEHLAEAGVAATFFVVGELVDTWRAELQSLVAAGHEVGLHGHTHRFLADLGPGRFAEELQAGRAAIEHAIGMPPTGFRAPYFSLTKATPWAPDLLTEAGFVYSSSVLPAWNPQAGWPGAPREPFRWPSGLVEFPAPVFGVGPLALPVLGGAYLRLVPAAAVRLAARRARRGAAAWTYAHPYDFDEGEPFGRREGQSWVVAKLLFARRRLMLPRVRSLTSSGSLTLAAHAARAAGERLPTFDPET